MSVVNRTFRAPVARLGVPSTDGRVLARPDPGAPLLLRNANVQLLARGWYRAPASGAFTQVGDVYRAHVDEDVLWVVGAFHGATTWARDALGALRLGLAAITFDVQLEFDPTRGLGEPSNWELADGDVAWVVARRWHVSCCYVESPAGAAWPDLPPVEFNVDLSVI